MRFCLFIFCTLPLFVYQKRLLLIIGDMHHVDHPLFATDGILFWPLFVTLLVTIFVICCFGLFFELCQGRRLQRKLLACKSDTPEDWILKSCKAKLWRWGTWRLLILLIFKDFNLNMKREGLFNLVYPHWTHILKSLFLDFILKVAKILGNAKSNEPGFEKNSFIWRDFSQNYRQCR